jgi:hypothetical protein
MHTHIHMSEFHNQLPPVCVCVCSSCMHVCCDCEITHSDAVLYLVSRTCLGP